MWLSDWHMWYGANNYKTLFWLLFDFIEGSLLLFIIRKCMPACLCLFRCSSFYSTWTKLKHGYNCWNKNMLLKIAFTWSKKESLHIQFQTDTYESHNMLAVIIHPFTVVCMLLHPLSLLYSNISCVHCSCLFCTSLVSERSLWPSKQTAQFLQGN